jgi:MOSC domain-containing protein YiiM
MRSDAENGHVEAIYLAASAGADPQAVAEATAVPGRGLEGDRYFEAAGTFSGKRKNAPGDGRDLTLIEAEAIEALAAEHAIELEQGAARRNVITRGISLNDLVGRRFRVGGVDCVGRRLCDPCAHLQKLTRPGVLRGLAGRGGLRADVLGGGTIAVGDEVCETNGDASGRG